MLMFIAAELMFFAALISAFLIISAAAEAWPPPDQPRLPIVASALNSLVLFASGWMIFKAYRSFKADPTGAVVRKQVKLTLWLGLAFVGFQGIEWIRLLSFGLTMTSSQYGAFFYLIIGTHAIHAVGALIGLWRLSVKLNAGQLTEDTFHAVQLFWFFVVGIWPILYVLVYLS
jgi:heme/copper-type cytochrome/quinol oxidase subunit 3